MWETEESTKLLGGLVFDGICDRLGLGVIVTDPLGRVVWVNDCVRRDFSDTFATGRSLSGFLQSTRYTVQRDPSPLRSRCPAPPAGDVHRVEREDGSVAYYRHLEFPVRDEPGAEQIHCLVDISREAILEETFGENLQQLTSMKEIIDTLYESVSTQEVLYLILVAVTSQRGFGFNRAFYLEARGDRLRGRIGIGPSSPEEAHQIWERLERINLPSLRAIYEDLTRHGSTPDPHTQEIAAQLDFPLHSRPKGLAAIMESRKPALLHNDASLPPEDKALFRLLENDEVAAVPLYVRESVAGVLIADNLITRRPITERALNVLKTFSGYAGVALERSQLYDELRESVSKLQSANETLKSHQIKLLQAEKLSAIGELAACVSHEIRNPMVAIGGLARSLLKDRTLGADSQEVLQVIVTEVGRLEKFLKETLDFVKPEVLGTISVDIRSEIDSALMAFRADLAESSIDLELDLGPEPLRCLIDPDLFRRAVSNLVKNSVEAVGNDGRIRIGVGRNGFSAKVEVADTGPGIPRELRGRVFEPFFTTKSEGTGLGLAIASQSIRSLGGEISLQENEEFGTIFTIILPLQQVITKGERGEEVERNERSRS